MINKLWEPTKDDIAESHLTKFIHHINSTYHLNLETFDAIHSWSVQNPELFWGESAKFLNIKFNSTPHKIVDDPKLMPGATWFEGATLNYAENCLRHRSNDLAIYEIDEYGLTNTVTWEELYQLVSRWHQFFIKKGIKKGDRIAGILPNNLVALAAMLGATSIGAVWSSCSPDFGEQGICDRLEQVNPKCIISISTYSYKGKDILITDRLNQIRESLTNTSIWVNASNDSIDGWMNCSEIDAYQPTDINFVPCEFHDPLFILFSSGTTGKPKCIVHGVGGTLLQHMKEHQFHGNMKEGDTLFYYTTCGWMMWNWMVSALASNVSLVLFDGAAITNSFSIWDLIEQYEINIFGCSASFIGASQKRKIDITQKLSGNTTRLILSTGSPLLPHHYDYLYSNFEYPIQVGSISGGTDIISCFALCNPITPVYRGLLQGKGLGMDIAAFDSNKQELIGVKGDLVCKTSAPCMPIYFLNDPNNERYKTAYFSGGKSNEWIHGDYVVVHENGAVEILGRSDSTLNPGGIRIGTAEFYQILDHFDGIVDSLVSSVVLDNEEKIVLFLKLNNGQSLTPEIKKEVRSQLKEKASPRHMPQMIVQVSQIPYTKNGKKCEVNVKRILRGEQFVVQESTLMSENSFDEYFSFAKQVIDLRS
tara:strand:+ start:8327 stop:10270 length:1944 start_codon:yes stop_codon:yes gene_type:complete